MAKSENEAARKTLTDAGIEVRDSNPEFDLTHQKSMVIDDEVGFVESLNWEPKDLTETRDYAVITKHGLEVQEMVACFDADWEQKEFKPHPESKLIWCPDNGRQRVAAFIDAAEKTLWVQNERYQDTVIIERLVRAADARRQSAYPDQKAALAESRQAHRRRWWSADSAGRRR